MGLLRERWMARGETRDVELYGLLRREWRAPTSPAEPAPPPGVHRR
ncbi:MAG: hypothetical protein ABI641_08700 [Caldimonas sp.]